MGTAVFTASSLVRKHMPQEFSTMNFIRRATRRSSQQEIRMVVLYTRKGERNPWTCSPRNGYLKTSWILSRS